MLFNYLDYNAHEFHIAVLSLKFPIWVNKEIAIDQGLWPLIKVCGPSCSLGLSNMVWNRQTLFR